MKLYVINTKAKLTKQQLQYFVVNVLWKAGIRNDDWIYFNDATAPDDENPILFLGGPIIAKLHGSINYNGKRCIMAIHHPLDLMVNPKLQPLMIREVKNLMYAAHEPEVLNRIHVYRDRLPDGMGRVFDLEWNLDGRITVIGIAESPTIAYSSYTYGNEIESFIAYIKAGGKIAGHNIIDADLPILGFTPKEILALVDNDQVFDLLISAHLNHPHWAADESGKGKKPPVPMGLYNLQSMRKFYGPCTNWKHRREDDLLYNGHDCAETAYNLEFEERLIKANGLGHLLRKDQELACLTLAMKQRGVKIDVGPLHEHAKKVELARNETRDKLAAEAPVQKWSKHKVPRPEPFNPNSPAQIKAWAKQIGISLSNTEYDTIARHRGKNDLFDLLIDYKEDTKELSNWFPVETVDDKIIITNDYIFPTFWVPGTANGRLSSMNPDFQNITKEGTKVYGGGVVKNKPNLRRFIIPRDPSLALWAFDFKAVEDWTFAICAGDDVLLQDLLDKRDIHRITAANWLSRVNGYIVNPEDITKDKRQIGKETNHSAKYGIQPTTLSIRMFGNKQGANVEAATGLLEAYFGRYKRCREFQQEVMHKAKNQALINPFGRRLRIYANNDHEYMKRGCSFYGSSTAADAFNQRAIDIWKETSIVPLLLVHDEVVIEGRHIEDGGPEVAAKIKSIIEQPFYELKGISLPVSVSMGHNYGSLDEIEV